MLTAQRKAHLLARLSQTGRVIARDEALALDLSEDTIRRDLRDLAAEGKLLRVHGGALPLSPTHRPLADRRTMAPDEKRRLGAAAARLIQPGQTVIIDGGTTHLDLVRHLPPDLAASIVTHSPMIAAALEPFAEITVILIGGQIFRHSMVALGSLTDQGYAALRADLCFLGVTGLHPETGLTTGNYDEAAIKRRMIAQSGETVVLATSDKIATTSPFRIAGLDAVATLITPGPRPNGLPASVTHLTA
jgi:DeoR/GlpR family transcriptional regulator of sugar metabolism